MGRAAIIVLPSAVGLALLSGAALAQNDVSPDEARLAFNNHCRQCHVTTAGDNRLGPSLHDVVGRKAGSVPGFPYSSAMKNVGITWDEQNLDHYIEKPDAVVPGNRMKPYPGVADPAERAKIIAHLKAASDGQ